jgi:hypothetical protein
LGFTDCVRFEIDPFSFPVSESNLAILRLLKLLSSKYYQSGHVEVI